MSRISTFSKDNTPVTTPLAMVDRPLSQVSNNQVGHSYLPSFAFQALESAPLVMVDRPLNQVSNDQVRHSYLPSFAFQALESDLHLFQRQHPCDHSLRNGGEVITAIYASTGATVVDGDGHVTRQDK